MSDFRNILKAGLMVSASILAVGCTDKNDTPDSGAAPGTNAGGGAAPGTNTGGGAAPGTNAGGGAAPGTNAGGGAAPGTALEVYNPVASFDAVKAFTSLGDAVSELDSTKAAKDGVFDIRGQIKMRDGSATANLDTSALHIAAKKGVTYAFNGTKLGALLLDAKEFPAGEYATATVDGPTEIDALILNNAVMLGKTGSSTLTVKSAYILNSALGRATPKETITSASILNLELEKGKKVTKHNATTVHDTKGKAKKTVKPKPAKHDVTLVLKTSQVTADQETKFSRANMATHFPYAAVDLAGYVADLQLEKGVLTAVKSASLMLDIFPKEGVEQGTTAHKTPAAVKLELSAKSAAKSKPKATKGKKHTDAKKTHEAKVAKKVHVTAQTLVSQDPVGKHAGKHSFMFQLDPKEDYAEVNDLHIGEGAEIQLLAHHPLIVHDLKYVGGTARPIGLRLFLEKGEMQEVKAGTVNWDQDVKADAQRWNPKGKGQDLIHKLKPSVDKGDISPISVNQVIHKDKANTAVEAEYEAFDDHQDAPFSLLGSEDTGGVHKFEIHAVDLGSSDVFEKPGLYFRLLAKDWRGTIAQWSSEEELTLAIPHDSDDHNSKPHPSLVVKRRAITNNGYADVFAFLDIAEKGSSGKLALDTFDRMLMSARAQGGCAVPTATLNAVTAQLDPTNLVAQSFANVSTARVNQAAQVASLVRGEAAASSVSMGAVDQYNVTFDHEGLQFGLTYTADGGNAFVGGKGTTAMGANIATKLGGLTAITSFEASADAGKSELVSSKHASYQAAVTFAKAYSAGGLSVVPMAGLGVATASLRDYNAAVPMAAGTLGLSLEDASFAAATFHAGVNFALDGFVAESAGVNASMALGVAGFLGSQTDAKLHTSEGRSADLHFSSHAAAPYAQFALDFATGERVNAMVSTGTAAVSFSVDR